MSESNREHEDSPASERSALSQKSPDAFRTISEVSIDLDVPQHVLRFWEGKFTQIRPMKRGGGRRYYRPDDIELLRGIQYLLYGDGYTIKGVQKLLREHGVKFVVAAGRRGAEEAETRSRKTSAARTSDHAGRIEPRFDAPAPAPVSATAEAPAQRAVMTPPVITPRPEPAARPIEPAPAIVPQPAPWIEAQPAPLAAPQPAAVVATAPVAEPELAAHEPERIEQVALAVSDDEEDGSALPDARRVALKTVLASLKDLRADYDARRAAAKAAH